VRLRITETPAFLRALANNERVHMPMVAVFTRHARMLVLGMCAALSTFVLFYLMTVFTLSWATSALGYTRRDFLQLQMISVVLFALSIPLSALFADRSGRRRMLLIATSAIIGFGLVFAPLFAAHNTAGTLLFLSLGMFLMGLTYGPLGTALAELFPTAVRYTGASLAFNLAGIFGASLAPYIATWLAGRYGLQFVGYYLAAAAAITLLALLLIEPERMDG
jgi:MFS family permease